MTPFLTKERGNKGPKGGGGVRVMQQKEVPFSNLRKMVKLLTLPVILEQ